MFDVESNLKQQLTSTEIALLEQKILELQGNMRMMASLWKTVNKKAIASQQKCDDLLTEIAVKDAIIQGLKERLNALS